MMNRRDGRNADEANRERADALERKMWGLSLIGAPLLLALSTVYWNDGRIAGVIQVYGLAMFIPAMFGVFHLLRDKLPRFAVWGAWLAVFLCVAGALYGVDRIYTDAFNIPGVSTLRRGEFFDAAGIAGYATAAPGLIFPLMLIVLGVVPLRTRLTPAWVALLLALGGLAFPISRIARIQVVGHISDVLLLIPLAWIGLQYLSAAQARTTLDTAAG